MDTYQQRILNAITRSDDWLIQLKLDKTYRPFYYTVFTKSEEEYTRLCKESAICFRLVDSNNGSTFEVTTGSFLPAHVRFFRIRRPTASSIEAAADILGQDLVIVQQELQRLGVTFHLLERPNNRIVEVVSANSDIAIYFPEKHFLLGMITGGFS